MWLFLKKKFHPFLAVRQYCERTHKRGVCVGQNFATQQKAVLSFTQSCCELEAFVFLDFVTETISRSAATGSRCNKSTDV